MTEADKKEKRIKNILAYLSPSVLSAIIPFITFPIMTRYLTPKDFGLIALAQTFPSIIANAMTFNVNVGAERYYFEYRKNINDLGGLVNTTIVFLSIMFLVSAPAVFLLKTVISNFVMGSPEYSSAIIVSYIGIAFGILFNFCLLMYRNMEDGKRYSFYTIVQMLVNTALGLTLVVFFGAGYMGVIYATLASVSIAFSMMYFNFLRKLPFSWNTKMLKDNLKYGIPLLPSLFTGSIYGFFDKYLLRAVDSLASAGLFSIAQNVSNKLFVFMTAVQSTFHPIFMKEMFDKGDEGSASIGRNFTIFTYISLSAVIMMVLFGEEFFRIMAPPSYGKAINVMLILLCGISTQTFGKLVGAQIAYVKKAYLSFPVSVLSLLINVGLNLILIPKFGPMGAGLSMTITILTINTIFVIISQRFYKIKYEKNLLFQLYLNIFISAIVLILFRHAGIHPAAKYGVKIIALFVFIYMGVKARIITRTNIISILNIFKLKKPATPENGELNKF
ncbi:MAG: oligosaccharide flippase family protein [Elusimicrobiota bacterium]